MLYPVSREQVAEIYVATFNRAPDQAGLVYWSTHADFKTIEPIAESFFHQKETQLLYPDSMSNSNFVNEIYNNLFNRDAEHAGLAYWVNALANGTTSRSNMIISIVNGAQGMDQKTLDNKTEVGLYFAQNGKTLSITQAYEVMVDVTNQGPSIVKAIDMIDNWGGGTSTIFLTTTIDIIDGSDNHMMIEGLVDTASPGNTTLNAGDIINGGAGNDILKVFFTGGISTTTYIPNMTNVETLMLETCIAGNCPLSDQELNLSGTTGLETIIVNSKANFTLTSTNHGTASLINGSTSSGELTILGGVVAVNGSTILGGTANDTIDISSATSSSNNEITGGLGADKITASSGVDTFNYANTGDTGITIDTADTISSFTKGTDKIKFNTLTAGSNTNFNGATVAVTNFDTAKTAADSVLNSTIIYAYQFDGSNGYLFIDNDADGTADEAIILSALGLNGIDFGDII